MSIENHNCFCIVIFIFLVLHMRAVLPIDRSADRGGCGLFVDWRYDLIFAVDLVIWTLNSCRFDDLEIGVDGDLASLKL